MNTDYDAATKFEERLSLSVFQSGRRRLEEGAWTYPGILGTFWRLYRNDRDGATVTVDGCIHPLRAGELTLVPPGVRFDCNNHAMVEHFYVHFDVLGLTGHAMRDLFDTPLSFVPPPDLAFEVALLAAAVLPELQNGSEMLIHQCRLQSLIYFALAYHLQRLSPQQAERGRQRSAAILPVLPAVKWIEQHLSERIGNTHLAALCHMNEDYFIQRFRECVGISPVSYIQERRVMSAAPRLLFTDQTIDAIAEAVGFGSRNYLSRVFKQRMGISPSTYRVRGARV